MNLALATPDTEPASRFVALDATIYVDGHIVTDAEACELIHGWATAAGSGEAESRIAALYHRSAMDLWRVLRQARLQQAAKRSRRGWAA